MQFRIVLILGTLCAGAGGISGCASTGTGGQSAASSARESSTAPASSLEVRPSPRFAIMGNRAIQVRLMVIITNADEDHWCPGYEIEWGDGERSTYEFDCKPFEETTARERERSYEPFRHWYRWPGVKRIRVRLHKAGRIIHAATTSVELN